MRVLAIDPGKTTGMALYRGNLDRAYAADGPVQGPPPPEWTAWAMPWQEAANATVDWIKDGQLDHVVCENFVISSRTVTQGKDAHWPIGGRMVAQWACHNFDVPFTLQMPSDAKKFVTNDKLKRIGWKTAGVDHPDDATRHLVLYLVKAGELDPLRLVL